MGLVVQLFGHRSNLINRIKLIIGILKLNGMESTILESETEPSN